MLKKMFRLAGIAGVLGLMNIQYALAQATATTGCELNGEPIPCEELYKQAGGLFAGLGAMMIIIPIVALVGFIFWLMMLIHAASKPIENKALWIVVQVLTGVVGSIVYYFVVKRKFDQSNKLTGAAPMGK